MHLNKYSTIVLCVLLSACAKYEPPPPYVYQEIEIEGPSEWRQFALSIQRSMQELVDYYSTDPMKVDLRKFKRKDESNPMYIFYPNFGESFTNFHSIVVSSSHTDGFSLSFFLADADDWRTLRETETYFPDVTTWSNQVMQAMLTVPSESSYSFPHQDDQVVTVVCEIGKGANMDVVQSVLADWEEYVLQD